MRRPSATLVLVVLIVLGAVWDLPARASDGDADLRQRIDTRRARVDALIAGELSPEVDAAALLSYGPDDGTLRPEDLQAIRDAARAQPATPRSTARSRQRARTARAAATAPSTSVDDARQRLVSSLSRFAALSAQARDAALDGHARTRVALAQQRARLEDRRERLERELALLEAFAERRLGAAADARQLMRIDLAALGPRSADELDSSLAAAVAALEIAAARTREEFWKRPEAERDELFAANAPVAAVPEPAPDEVPEAIPAVAEGEAAQSRVDDAEQARAQALADAKSARTEALRRTAQERARLLGIKAELAKTAVELARQDEDLVSVRARIDALTRRVEELVEPAERFDESPPGADALYDEVRAELTEARARLEKALDETGSPISIPEPGELAGIADQAPDVAELHRELGETAAGLAQDVSERHWSHVEAYRDDIVRLNAARLRLLGVTSASVRDELTGFGGAGVQQVGRELDQIGLELRYRARSLPRSGSAIMHALRTEPVAVALGLAKLVLLILVFRGWRKRAPAVLARLQQRDPKRRRRAFVAGAAWYLGRIRKPLEWLAFAAAIYFGTGGLELLPELQLLWLIVLWLMIGSATILAVDAVAARQHRRLGEVSKSAPERIRSLRLIGLCIVYTGLVLSLANALVGRGAIYNWVLRTCWLLLIPVAITLTRWWRPHVREALQSEPSAPFIDWAQRTDKGVPGFVATAVAGLFLLARGVWRWLVRRAAVFEGTRHVLAYLFRREVARAAEGATEVGPLVDEEMRARFTVPAGPDDPLVSAAAEEIELLAGAIRSDEPTVSALIGERGMGKTTALHRLRSELDGHRIVVVQCPAAGFAGLVVSLAKILGIEGPVTPETTASALRELGPVVIAIDDAQRLVRPTIGGLRGLDEFWTLSRAAGPNVSWVMAMGAAAWQYVSRARNDRLHFTQVVHLRRWTEREIAELIRARCTGLGISPSFEGLVVPRQYDDEELDERERSELGYYRILWDYSGGNPHVASFFWGESLHEGTADAPLVRLFHEPPAAELDGLALPLQFVLRALVQLEQASKPELAAAIRLPLGEVDDALRFAMGRGYTERDGSVYSIAWPWYRAITTMLQRQHLLAA